jgi:mono/diheme cytochrome c family protein
VTLNPVKEIPRRRLSRLLIVAVIVLCWRPSALFPQSAPPPGRDGQQIYQAACAACHAADGRGAPQTTVGFDIPLPDFTDCNFTAREPDSDWMAIVHEGGPARGFAEMMPSFAEALSGDEMQRVLDHLRSFCGDPVWPRGELNLPRALVTEKAFPEDEAVLTVTAAAEGPGSVTQEILYERRFGVRNQVEVAVPFKLGRADNRGWIGGVGDIALAFKRTLFHSLRSGSILSVTGEAVLPTGDKAKGTGKGVTVLEPFATFGQILPRDGFLQFQGGFELPTHLDDASREGFWRIAGGKTFTQGGFGRAWSPMVELLGARELESGAKIDWDLLPQMQVTLSTRQHIMLNFGVRLPLTDAGPRPTQVMLYLLWDWFDGGLRDGW